MKIILPESVWLQVPDLLHDLHQAGAFAQEGLRIGHVDSTSVCLISYDDKWSIQARLLRSPLRPCRSTLLVYSTLASTRTPSSDGEPFAAQLTQYKGKIRHAVREWLRVRNTREMLRYAHTLRGVCKYKNDSSVGEGLLLALSREYFSTEDTAAAVHKAQQRFNAL